MRALSCACIVLSLTSCWALADNASLAGSLWLCARATDRSQFVITFYSGGGVGGGELQDGEVNPYVFDASNMEAGEWPGRWDQKGLNFTWSFPDQHMEISGAIVAPGTGGEKLTGTEVGPEVRSGIRCRRLSKLPKIGEGLVIPRDGHFLDRDDEEGELKVRAGISLQER